MSLAPLTTRDISAAQAKGDDLGAGTSAIAPQPVALADTTTRSRGISNGYPRSTKELRKCLTFHAEKQIPQAEHVVEQRHRATARVPTKTHMQRMYYDSTFACCFQCLSMCCRCRHVHVSGRNLEALLTYARVLRIRILLEALYRPLSSVSWRRNTPLQPQRLSSSLIQG